MNKVKFLNISILFYLVIFLLQSCNADREDFQGEKYGSINAGELSIYCEESIYGLLDSAMTIYENAYPKIKLTRNIVTAREAMRLLLSGNAEAVITSRAFLLDEDSLMKEFKVERPEMIAASDALVFYTRLDFPLDTLNDFQVKSVLLNESKFTDYFSSLQVEPELVCNSTNSSEFANIKSLILGSKDLVKYLKSFQSCDSVMNYILKTPNSIGIGYLSQIYGNKDLKALQIGFENHLGKRILPQQVHQGFIIQDKYPYINKIRVLLKDNLQNRAFWFASFISKESVVQKYFLDKGIVPEYARIKLHKQ